MSQSTSDTFPVKDPSQSVVKEGLYPSPDQVISYHSDWTKKHYPERIVQFKKHPLQLNDIVFIGDSITEQGGDWGNRFGSDKIKNRGISGDVTEGVLIRLGEVCSVQPLAVFILIGINDTYLDKSPEFIANNIVEITNTISKNSPSTKIYVQTILPTSLSSLVNKIRDANSLIRSNARSGSYTVIELHEVFAVDNNLIKKAYTDDGTHLTPEGYNAWVCHEKSLIDDLLKSVKQ